jgi:transposase
MLPPGRTPTGHVAFAPVHLAPLDSEVRTPPVLDEAVRDVCRARTDATDDLSRSKQRLSAFLLRNGFNYTGKSN